MRMPFKAGNPALNMAAAISLLQSTDKKSTMTKWAEPTRLIRHHVLAISQKFNAKTRISDCHPWMGCRPRNGQGGLQRKRCQQHIQQWTIIQKRKTLYPLAGKDTSWSEPLSIVQSPRKSRTTTNQQPHPSLRFNRSHIKCHGFGVCSSRASIASSALSLDMIFSALDGPQMLRNAAMAPARIKITVAPLMHDTITKYTPSKVE